MDVYNIGEYSFKNGFTRAVNDIFNELDDSMWEDELKLTLEEYEMIKKKFKSDYNYIADKEHYEDT